MSQLTRVYRDRPTWETAVAVLLIFVPVWWAWTGMSFALDRFPAVAAYLHFPLVVGIAAAAAGGQITLRAPTAAISVPAAAAITLGCCAYLPSMNVMTFVLRVQKAESLGQFRPQTDQRNPSGAVEAEDPEAD